MNKFQIICQSAEDKFKEKLKKLRTENLNRVIIIQININSIKTKIELLSETVSETKIGMPFPVSQFIIQGLVSPFRLHRTNTGG